ncbi:hypothetical protein CCP2SC5_290029 [Azospirillaceae bacterium]
MLMIVIDKVTAALPRAWVRRVLYPSAITPLPFSPSSVEGVAVFDGRPIVVVSPTFSAVPAMPLCDKSRNEEVNERWVVIGPPDSLDCLVALRVSRTLGFIEGDGSPCASDATVPLLLSPECVAPWLFASSYRFTKCVSAPLSLSTPPTIPLLCVETGHGVIGLFLTEVLGVVSADFTEVSSSSMNFEVSSLLPPLIRVNGRLIPAHSLNASLRSAAKQVGSPSAFDAVEEPWVILGRNGVTEVVGLLVHRVLKLHHCPAHYIHRLRQPLSRETRFVLDDGQTAFPVYDFADLIASPTLREDQDGKKTPSLDENGALDIVGLIGGKSADQTLTGLRLTSAEFAWSVPLALIEALEDTDQTQEIIDIAQNAAPKPSYRNIPANATPVFDVSRLLGANDRDEKIQTGFLVRLRLADHQRVALWVAHANEETDELLCDDAPLEEGDVIVRGWRTPPALPPVPAALFDAVRWENGFWTLRLRTELTSAGLPWIFRRALRRSLIGWFSGELNESRDCVPGQEEFQGELYQVPMTTTHRPTF